MYRSAPCLPAHKCVLVGVLRFLGLCFFFCLLDVCLHDDDNTIANLEPGVSGRNSLPLPGTPGPRALQGFSRFGRSWGHLGRILFAFSTNKFSYRFHKCLFIDFSRILAPILSCFSWIWNTFCIKLHEVDFYIDFHRVYMKFDTTDTIKMSILLQFYSVF